MRKTVIAPTSKAKDKRIVFKNHVIDLGDNRVTIDGKYNPVNNTLKVYKYHGDINRSKEALALLCSTYPFPVTGSQITVKTNFNIY